MKRWIASLCRWILAWAERPPVPEVRVAVHEACLRSGVSCDPSTDLYRTGKLHEVLFHTAEVLDVDASFRTVQDVIDLFEERR
jgi:hypothetical protein